MSDHNLLGIEGENEAAKFIKKKGYTLLARNYRYGRAEVDIIAKYLHYIIFVEVKTRTSYAYGYPESFVTAQKQKLIVKAAENYLYVENYKSECRFDILAIYKSASGHWIIDHFEDAFYPNEST
jgi:putative endonuclease